MGYHKDTSDGGNYVRHEIKTYHRKGDQVRSEYERLNSDGTVTKSVAYGDCKEGLRYRTFQMGLDGAVRELAPEHFAAKPISAAPQQQQYHQPAPQQRYHQPAPQQQAPQSQPRKAYAFVVEPKTQQEQPGGAWRLRPLKIQQEKPAETSPQKDTPWWFEPLKEALREEPKEEPVPERLPEEPERKRHRNIFDLFDNDLFNCPFIKSVFRPQFTNPFDSFLGDSFFDRPRLGFSRALLEDF